MQSFYFVSWLLCMWLAKNSCSQGPLGGKVFRVGAEGKAVGVGDAASERVVQMFLKQTFRLKGRFLLRGSCVRNVVLILYTLRERPD